MAMLAVATAMTSATTAEMTVATTTTPAVARVEMEMQMVKVKVGATAVASAAETVAAVTTGAEPRAVMGRATVIALAEAVVSQGPETMRVKQRRVRRGE